IAEFDLADVSRNPATFDPDKLSWMNGEYIRAMETGAFSTLVRPYVEAELGRPLDADEWGRFSAVASLVQERTKLLPDAGSQVAFLFEDFDSYDAGSWDKVMTKEGVSAVIAAGIEAVAGAEPWGVASVEAALRALPDHLGIGAGKTFQPLRVAVTGSSVSPPLFESITALGRERTLERLHRAARELAAQS
ncbi:MAG: glutamate--tRNA ligase, partial [Acidimicrobiia bacterium]